MNVRGNINAAAARSYHAAWMHTVARLWEEDQRRMEWLDRHLKREKARVRNSPTPEEVEKRRAASRDYMRRKRDKERIPCRCGNMMDPSSTLCAKCVRVKTSPCIVCGRLKASEGCRCRKCSSLSKCPSCGLIQDRRRDYCRDCNRSL